ncbi:hypothetical protein D3C71_301260 [compost metagenome]
MTSENSTVSADRVMFNGDDDAGPQRRPHPYLEIALIGAVMLGMLHLFWGSRDDTGRILSDATRHFVARKLDRSCSADGMLADRGMPCADSGGYRFVLGRHGRYEIYAVAGVAPLIVARSAGSPVWTGTPEQLSELERLAAGTEDY